MCDSTFVWLLLPKESTVRHWGALEFAMVQGLHEIQLVGALTQNM